jgi:protein-S-isoprenylcysteine O-methyltransferase Ste14
MSQAQLLRLVGWIWAAFGVYWLLAGLKGSAARTRESGAYRVGRIALLFLVFLLLFSRRTAIGILGLRFLPRSPAPAFAGFMLALVGMAIAAWARIHLGQFWSDKVILKVNHQLIRTGPYARMRHPIYSGMMLAVAGTAFIVGEWRGLIAFLLLLVNYSIKARKEEDILARQFGDAFRLHRGQAGFLLPKFRSRVASS